jgi:16S rRNA (cytosine967-C5)-methyltransferase
MNPRLPNFLIQLYRQICQQPHLASSVIHQNITRNRSLSSTHRRRFHQWLLDGLRWRYDWDNWLDVGVATFDEFDTKLDQLQKQISVEACTDASSIARTWSMPQWLVESLLQNRTPLQVANLLGQHIHRPLLTVRVNAWKKSKSQVKEWLDANNQQAQDVPKLSYALELPAGTPLSSMLPMRKGWLEIQDLASQYLVEQMGVQRWQTVIDGCARSGGKTLAMASHMQGEGTFYLFDVDARLLEKTKKRMAQAGLAQTHVDWIAPEDANPMPHLARKADHVLVDAPCSSIGTLARRPWLKWSLTPEKVHAFSMLQSQILARQAQWVKPGGQLVYATCSWLYQENRAVVDKFLGAHSDFSLKRDFQAEDELEESNGFYGAYFVRA